MDAWRDECLNTNWFMSLDDAKSKIEAWRRHYNETRLHTALGFVSAQRICSTGRAEQRPLVQRCPKTSPRPWTNIGGPSQRDPKPEKRATDKLSYGRPAWSSGRDRGGHAGGEEGTYGGADSARVATSGRRHPGGGHLP